MLTDWLTEWGMLRACTFKQKVLACWQGCAHPLHQSDRERDKERDRKRVIEWEKEGGRERCRIWLFLFLKGMAGALAPFSYLVSYSVSRCHFHLSIIIVRSQLLEWSHNPLVWQVKWESPQHHLCTTKINQHVWKVSEASEVFPCLWFTIQLNAKIL